MLAAAENWHRRRRLRADRERRTSDIDGTRSFLHRATWVADFLHPPADAQPRAPETWTPHDWTPRDRSAQSWIPHGWKPKGWAPRDDEPPAQQGSAAMLESGTDCACRILGVTLASTREQIRSAYRRRVSQCHPDHLQRATEEVRKLATQQMAELNDAYRLLCAVLPQQAA